MAEFDMFIPLVKVDEEKRLVYGIATAQVEDRSGEICDYASAKEQYQIWSGEMAKVTDGGNLGNLRAMHGKVAAGKITDINYNDSAAQIEICAKVVDDNEWNKVLEGVYTGFSQGGAYLRKWKDKATGKTWYTPKPSEVSLVDRPCLKIANFLEIQKADGSVQKLEFQVPTEEDIEQDIEDMLFLVASGVAIEKFDDVTRWGECIEGAERGILETFAKYSDDQPRDSSGRWAAAAVGAAIGGAKGAVLGALTAGQAGAIIGGISGAISGAAETSDNHYVRAGGQLLETATSVVGVGTIASRMLSARSNMSAAVSGAKAVFGAAEAGQSASEAARELTDPAARGHAESMIDKMRAEANAQYDAAQSEVDKARTEAQKKFDAAVKRQAAKMKSDTTATEARSKLRSVKGGKKDSAEKSDSTGDLKKMDITNEMVFEKAKELATAAGDVSRTGDFVTQARELLEKGDQAPEMKKVEPTTELKPEERKPTEDWGVRQVWMAKDGSTHEKKADALAKNDALALGDSPLLRMLDKAIGITGERSTSIRDVMAKYAGEEAWDASRAIEALNTVFGLLTKELSESEKAPEQIASLQKAVDGLKTFIASEIMEDNSSPEQKVMALFDGINELSKADDAGAKKLIQEIHDRTAQLGGSCKAEKADSTEELAKRDAVLEAIGPKLEKLLEINTAKDEKIAGLEQQIQLLRKAVAPPPRLVVADKSKEISISGGSSEMDLEKLQSDFTQLSDEQKALVMTKLAQSQPKPMKAAG